MPELLARVQQAVGDAFRLESELPSGGMSRVFLATEASLNRQVIVKVLPPELTSEVSAARFRQEADLLARLQHPHILPILQTGAHEGLLYYITPFVPGESVRHRLESGEPFAVEEAVRIIGEVADALGYAHSAGVLHRDIKPGNILLEGRHAVLADFGVARAVQQSRTGDRLTATGVAIGTPGYMSPEQFAGDEIDARADLYALAVVGYEMLTGQPPFVGATAHSVMAAHLTTSPPAVVELRPEVPEHVSRAIARALSKKVEDRYRTAEDFREALEGRGPRAGEVRRGFTSRWWMVAAGAAVAGLLVWFASSRPARVDPELLGALRSAADSGWIDEMAMLIDEAGVAVDDPAVREMLGAFTGELHTRTTPADASVEVKRVEPIRTFPERSYRRLEPGTREAAPLLTGEYLVRVTAPSFQDRLALVNVLEASDASVEIELLAADSALAGKVLVTAGPSPVGATVPGFLIKRTEVTNEEYLAFMSAGAYRDRSLWPERSVLDGEEVGWANAMQRLVDRTGLPGPRSWEGGRFQPGRGDHPVTGITWYEAAAFARWAGGALPAAAHWWRAAMGDSTRPYPWGPGGAAAHLRANLEGVEAAPVGTYVLGVSPFGALDMAGNVREWLGDPATDDGRRLTSGGSWQEPLYTASPEWMERFPPGHATDGLGFRVLWWLDAEERRP